MLNLRTGLDLLEIGRLERLNPAIRQRFLRRVFTAAELAEVGESQASLGGWLAAKEAVAKALGCGIGTVGWKEIELRCDPLGAPCLTLHGKAKRLAQDLGLVTWSISISHTASHAAAVAVAIGRIEENKLE
ncbi:MAG: holo-ACP synthase [Anaerolineaceae bacterium]|nr:holo-ACP synthase [Anaerolineaceae bacterium]